MTSVAADFVVSFTHLNTTMEDLRRTDSAFQFKTSKDWSDGYGFFLNEYVDAEEFQFQREGCTGFGCNYGDNHDDDHNNINNNSNNSELNEFVKDDDTDGDSESLCESEDMHVVNSEIIFLHQDVDNSAMPVCGQTNSTNTLSTEELTRMTIKWNPLSKDC